MNHCSSSVDRISSCSLKHLRITDCRSVWTPRVRVSAPGLVSLTLKLDRFDAKAPCLENMASLETAHVYLGPETPDVCLNYRDSGGFCGANHNMECKNCAPVKDDRRGDSVLLGGVSSAKHLELISEPANFIFSRDLKRCPTFSKLKSLLLNEYWCDAPGLDPLLCILKNSPVLEKLTLQLFSKGPNYKLGLKGSYSSKERPSTISEHLNIIEVKCDDVVGEKVNKIMKLLCATLNIGFIFE
ncbi:hypothetical protein VPH35_108910 [Triticum aestivum]